MKKEDVLDFILGFFTLLLMVLCFLVVLYLAAGLEDEIRCRRGATQYCLEDNNAKENN